MSTDNQYYSGSVTGSELYKNNLNFNFNNYNKYQSKKYYEWINKNFNDYSFNPEYSSKTFEDICENPEYSLKPQQKFAGKIFNTNVDNSGILIFHGLGSGKTQTSIVIGEAFKFRDVNGNILRGRQENDVLIVVPAALVEQYYSEIIGFIDKGLIKSASGEILINGERQYYINKALRNTVNLRYKEIERLKEELKTSTAKDIIKSKIVQKEKEIFFLQNEERNKVKRVYEILSHERFLNRLFKKEGNNPFINGEYIERLNSPNGLLIIDEAQNLISGIGSSYRKLLYALRLYAHPKFRTVLLSGTPIYDKPFEIGLMINLLRPRIPFPDGRDNFNEFFLKDNQMVNKPLFKKLCSGYISYFKGGNPEAYPYKKIIIMHHSMNPYQYNAYKIKLISEVTKDQQINKESKEDFIVKIVSSERKNDETATSVFNNSRLFCNIVFPEVIISNEQRGVLNRQNISDLGLAEFKKILNAGSKENVLKLASNYSSKFAKVASLIEISEGPVFVYSNYVNYGVESMAAIMNAIGYFEFPQKGQKGSYFIWKGGVDEKLIANAKKAFNSLSNANGSRLKIMFGTQSVMEGVDFKRVRQVHVLDPWWNDSRMQQIIARAIRLCSHSGLPESQRITDVFIHLSTLGSGETLYKVEYIGEDCNIRKAYSLLQRYNDTEPDSNKWRFYESGIKMDKTNTITDIYPIKSKIFTANKIVSLVKLADPSLTRSFGTWKKLDTESVEQYMWGRALNKLYINRQFEKVIKDISIDCELNKNGNIIRLDEYYIPDSRENIYKLEYLNYSTGKKYIRLGVKSQFNTNLEDNYLTLQDIFSNTAKNSGLFKFQDTDTGEILELNKKLIVSEDIQCDLNGGDYIFNNIPAKIVNSTINKEFIPYLMKIDFKKINKYLLEIKNKTITANDPKLISKIEKFNNQTLNEKQRIIDAFKEFNIGDDLLWELYDLDELKKEYLLIFKKKFFLK